MLRGKPAWGIGIGCLVVALLSVLLLTWPPSSDPFAWIAWGQEVTDPHALLTLNGGPSWKPFPVFFTTIFGLFGNAEPSLWLIMVRTVGLLGVYGAFRVGRRLGGWPAGTLAAIALLLMSDYLRYMARGTSEPLIVAAVLWAVELHLDERPRFAYVLLVLGSLNRPELSAFAFLYAVYLWFRVPGSRALAVGGLLLIPIGWLVPPWINTGNAFQANSAALGGQGGQKNGLDLLVSSHKLLTLPVLLLAGVGAGLAAWRRDRTLLALAVIALAWALVAAFETQVTFGETRYLLAGGAIGCVVAGVAVVRLAELAGARGGRWTGFGLGALVIALTLPWTIPRAGALGKQVREANLAGHVITGLFRAVDRSGGRRAVVPCRRSEVAVNHTAASALAWKLEIPLTRSHGVLHGTGFAFVHAHVEPTGSPPRIRDRAVRQLRVVTSVDGWRVIEVTRRGASLVPHCR